ncbi:MAG: M48 family metallopeptidase [Salinigranum sp.]
MLTGPRLRTALELWARATLVAAILLPLVTVLFVVAVLSGLLLGMILAGLLGYVITPPPWLFVGLLVVGVVASLYGGVTAIRSQVRTGRERLLERATPVVSPNGDYGWFVRTVGRLAAQVDVPTPATRVHLSSAPLAYTVLDGDEPAVVVSVGLLDALPPEEAEAVLAHEVAHVANRDLRWMSRAMAPLLGAEEYCETFVDEDDDDPREIPSRLFGRLLVAWGQFGAGLFSRGREFAADLGSAEITGDPGALASALARLDRSVQSTPTADLRAVEALNVLPTGLTAGGLVASHPPTEERIERLRALERESERR